MKLSSASGQPPVILSAETEAALARREQHIAADFSIIPLIDTTKLPALKWERHKTVRADLDQAVAWMCGEALFKRHPAREDLNVWSGRNHGIVTGSISEIVVLDLDDERAIRVAEHLGLPSTVMAATPRGRHEIGRAHV